ncbi:MAG: cysteine desulfurase [Anaerolineales bacterium]|nr:cysteine desulfurase [Anaerolineales bacterium]
MIDRVYLDYAATTPVDPRVLEVMLPYFNEIYGNPSSVHQFGQPAESAVEDAREVVAGVLNCEPAEVFFTSCGSESDNLALRGVGFVRQKQGKKILVTSKLEHHAVSKTAEQLRDHFGFTIFWLDADQGGIILPEQVDRALSDQVALVSLMYANNEIGTINPVAGIAEVCHQRGIPFHTDAVQAAGYLPVEVGSLGVDLLSLGGHKLYGPKGVGALYVRKGTPLLPHLTGGSQERGLRAGTHNVPLIVGFAEALKLAAAERDQRILHVRPMRDRILGSVLEEIPDTKITGHPENRLPNHASFVFKGVDGNLLLMLLDADGFACSSGSACKTGSPEPSEVLSGLDLSPEWALGSLRVTLGSATTSDQVTRFLSVLPGLVQRARSLGN